MESRKSFNGSVICSLGWTAWYDLAVSYPKPKKQLCSSSQIGPIGRWVELDSQNQLLVVVAPEVATNRFESSALSSHVQVAVV